MVWGYKGRLYSGRTVLSRPARPRPAPPPRSEPPRADPPVVCPGFESDRFDFAYWASGFRIRRVQFVHGYALHEKGLFPDMPDMKKNYKDKKATVY